MLWTDVQLLLAAHRPRSASSAETEIESERGRRTRQTILCGMRRRSTWATCTAPRTAPIHRRCARDPADDLRIKLILHHRRTDPRAFLQVSHEFLPPCVRVYLLMSASLSCSQQMRRDQATYHGARPLQQDALRFLLRRVLHAPGRAGLHEIHWRHQARRTHHPHRSRPGLSRRAAIWV